MPNKARVTMVAAIDYGLAIGRAGKLPWRLAADMEHFKKLTTGKIVVMGRKTYESIPPRFRPLPERENWILSRDQTYEPAGCTIFRSKEELLLKADEEELFVIGGAEIYTLFFPDANRLVLTHVETHVERADTFFPPVPADWNMTLLKKQGPDSKNQFGFSIVEYRLRTDF